MHWKKAFWHCALLHSNNWTCHLKEGFFYSNSCCILSWMTPISHKPKDTQIYCLNCCTKSKVCNWSDTILLSVVDDRISCTVQNVLFDHACLLTNYCWRSWTCCIAAPYKSALIDWSINHGNNRIKIILLLSAQQPPNFKHKANDTIYHPSAKKVHKHIQKMHC